MPDQADDDDALETPFDLSRRDPSGERQEPSAEAKKALGLPVDDKTDQPASKVEDPDQKKSDKEGKKVVDNYSAKIQEKAEELYATEERLALRDSAHLDKLLASSDKTDRKNAEKILKRNPDAFGAATVDAYKLSRAKAAAGNDPVRQKLVEVDHEIAGLKQEKRTTEWKEWKLENSVRGDLSKVADEVYSEYPDLPFADLLSLAKGRAGVLSPSMPGKREGSSPVGGGSPSQNETISPELKGRFRISPKAEQFAKEYLGY